MNSKHFTAFARFACGGLAAIGITSTSALAQNHGNAPDAGVWFGGFAGNRGAEFSVEVTAFEDVGEIKLEGRRWQDFGSGRCNYAFSKTNDILEIIALNPASSSSSTCPDTIAFSSQRLSADQIEISFGADLSTAIGFDVIQLNANLRPLREEDRAIKPEGLDILGIHTSMAQQDVEAALIELGFSLDGNPRVRVGEGFKRVQQHWSRNITDEGWMSDHISVAYSADYESNDEPSRLISIARQNTPQELTPINVFEAAINDKYGPVMFSSERLYLRDGTNANSRKECPRGSLQSIKFGQIIFTNSGGGETINKFNLYCGSTLHMNIYGDRTTGAVRDYRMSLVDPDEVWADFWTQWSTSNAIPIHAFLDAPQNMKQSAPEL